MKRSAPHTTRTRYGRVLVPLLLIAACHSRDLGGTAGGGSGNTSGEAPIEPSARPWLEEDHRAQVGRVRVRRPPPSVLGLGGGSAGPKAGTTGIAGELWTSGGSSGEATGGHGPGGGGAAG